MTALTSEKLSSLPVGTRIDYVRGKTKSWLTKRPNSMWAMKNFGREMTSYTLSLSIEQKHIQVTKVS